ncbi:hypothetical protein SAMD00019534_081100 [Acytostelium subglobosum LB1]|uniref:hypothetical protein n=1 Tax=Acytostelium subglobosum LB1 TaxID=1410327 RepID=UPI0006452241|nr:hypothetical protein SAMD00019534_081100 [Acytostelium subglobosum LB1]GAM24935.1 hypothetical protein SAMD00019534_081100 [Acytostelium subglobosum LB1]|eukprot:XP_012752024.1 hypothetical protein SAMD00019534_081100 [Acytostelium subglobosum LB1]
MAAHLSSLLSVWLESEVVDGGHLGSMEACQRGSWRQRFWAVANLRFWVVDNLVTWRWSAWAISVAESGLSSWRQRFMAVDTLAAWR